MGTKLDQFFFFMEGNEKVLYFALFTIVVVLAFVLLALTARLVSIPNSTQEQSVSVLEAMIETNGR